MTGTRQQREVTREEALRLLGSVPLGRVVFTHRALPAIRPVNHIVDGQQIIFQTSTSAAITTAVDGTGADCRGDPRPDRGGPAARCWRQRLRGRACLRLSG